MDLSRVSAVIVNHNTENHVVNCVDSVGAEGIGEIVVVDNGSTDNSIARLRAGSIPVEVVEQDNVGFGAGVNAGVAVAKGDYLLVLNADTFVQSGAVKALGEAIEKDPGLAAVGPRLENSDGTLYPSARVYPSLRDAIGHGFLGLIVPDNPFSRRYKMLDWNHGDARPVDWISGASFLVRREAFESIGGFDEAYFMYMEDVDLCWRWGKAGWRVAYEPSGTVTHSQGASTDRHPYRMIMAHHRSLLRFSWRTATPRRRMVFPIVMVGLGLRSLLACAHRASVGRFRSTAGGNPSHPSDV